MYVSAGGPFDGHIELGCVNNELPRRKGYTCGKLVTILFRVVNVRVLLALYLSLFSQLSLNEPKCILLSCSLCLFFIWCSLNHATIEEDRNELLLTSQGADAVHGAEAILFIRVHRNLHFHLPNSDNSLDNESA